jgi:hypothetical protein
MALYCLRSPSLRSNYGTCLDRTVILNCFMYEFMLRLCAVHLVISWGTLCALNCVMHKTRISEHYLNPTVIFHTLLHLCLCYVFVDIIA